MSTPKHAPGIEWRAGKLFIDGEPAHKIAAQAVQSGMVQPRRPRNWKSPEEARAYRRRRRAAQTRCMAEIRESRWKKDPCPKLLAFLARLASDAKKTRNDLN